MRDTIKQYTATFLIHGRRARIFGQIFDQIFAQVFDHGFWPGFWGLTDGKYN